MRYFIKAAGFFGFGIIFSAGLAAQVIDPIFSNFVNNLMVHSNVLNAQQNRSRTPVGNRMVNIAGKLADALNLLAQTPVIKQESLNLNANSEISLASLFRFVVQNDSEAVLLADLLVVDKLIAAMNNQTVAHNADGESLTSNANVAGALGNDALRSIMSSDGATKDVIMSSLDRTHTLYSALNTVTDNSLLDSYVAGAIAEAIYILETTILGGYSVIDSEMLQRVLNSFEWAAFSNASLLGQIGELSLGAEDAIVKVAQSLAGLNLIVAMIAAVASSSSYYDNTPLPYYVDINYLTTLMPELINAAGIIVTMPVANESAIDTTAEGVHYLGLGLSVLLTNTNATLDLIATCTTGISSLSVVINNVMKNSNITNDGIQSVLESFDPVVTGSATSHASVITPLFQHYNVQNTFYFPGTNGYSVIADLSATDFYSDLLLIVNKMVAFANSPLFIASATTGTAEGSDTSSDCYHAWQAFKYAYLTVLNYANDKYGTSSVDHSAVDAWWANLGQDYTVANVQGATAALASYIEAIQVFLSVG